MNIFKIFSPAHVIAKVRYKLSVSFPSFFNRYQTVAIRNLVFHLDLNDHPQQVLYGYRNLYEKYDIKCVLKLVSEGDTFVDVGANAGLFSKLVRSHIGTHGKIHSFEANPISVASLRKNLEEYGNVVIHEHFVGNKNDPPINGKNLVFLDAILKEKIDFLKIDVDGPELNVLRGSTRLISKYRPIILLEIAPDTEKNLNIHFSEIVDYLEQLNYLCFKPLKRVVPFKDKKITGVQNILCIHRDNKKKLLKLMS